MSSSRLYIFSNRIIFIIILQFYLTKKIQTSQKLRKFVHNTLMYAATYSFMMPIVLFSREKVPAPKGETATNILILKNGTADSVASTLNKPPEYKCVLSARSSTFITAA